MFSPAMLSKSAITTALLGACIAVLAQTNLPQATEPLPPIDASQPPSPDVEFGAQQRTAVDTLMESIPGLQVQLNPLTGTPSRVRNTTGLLTEPSEQPFDAPDIIKNFLRENPAMFRLSRADLNTLMLTREVPSGATAAVA